MAQVNFSNAVLTPVGKPLEGGSYLDVYNDTTYGYRRQIVDSEGTGIVTNYSVDFLEKTINRMSFVYSGEFTASGTDFYIAYVPNVVNKLWRVSNISFSTGDTFSFKITIAVTT